MVRPADAAQQYLLAATGIVCVLLVCGCVVHTVLRNRKVRVERASRQRRPRRPLPRRRDNRYESSRNGAPIRAARGGRAPPRLDADDLEAMRVFEQHVIEPELSGCNEFKFSREGEQVEAFEVDDEIAPDDSVSMAMWSRPPPQLPPPPRLPPPRPSSNAAPCCRLATAAARSGPAPDQEEVALEIARMAFSAPRAPQPPPHQQPPHHPPPRAPPPARPQYGRPPPQASDDEMTLMALSTPVSARGNPHVARQPRRLAGVRETIE